MILLVRRKGAALLGLEWDILFSLLGSVGAVLGAALVLLPYVKRTAETSSADLEF